MLDDEVKRVRQGSRLVVPFEASKTRFLSLCLREKIQSVADY